jgi:3'-phosphoadenosine 5'-phosphosulfate (PAPS) 3'-phosphatase
MAAEVVMIGWSEERQTLLPLFDLARQAAAEASERILAHYQGEFEMFRKEIGTHTGDIVTSADHEAQRVILQRLACASPALLEQTALLAEEMADHQFAERFQRPYVFLIDPLDGTRGFVDRTNSFAVSIGLVRQNHQPLFGVVDLPGIGHQFSGWADGPVFGNGLALRPRELAGQELVLWVSEAEIFPSEKNHLWHALIASLRARLPISRARVQVLASPVHKGVQLLSSPPGLYLGLPRRSKGVSLWDLAAIAALVQGSGGHVSDARGEALELNRQESTYCHHHGFVFASHPEIGEEVLRFLRNDYPNHHFDA